MVPYAGSIIGIYRQIWLHCTSTCTGKMYSALQEKWINK